MASPGSTDSSRKGSGYYPQWLDNLANDATLEGAAMNGTVRGAEDVHAVVVEARKHYEFQDFPFHDKYGDNGFLEDYTSSIQGKPLNVIVTVLFNGAGQAQHVVVNHRPRSSLLLFSHLMHEQFAGSPLAEHFLAEDPETDGHTTIGSAAARAPAHS
jgi:hypothetical protein